jgi:ABC-type uncharacterized transport system substrate-binding protein
VQSLALRQATAVIPIVFAIAVDAVGSGIIASLSHPGGNVTGLSIEQSDIAGKRLELLREIVPGLRRLAIMFDGGYPAAVRENNETQAAARVLGLDVVASALGMNRTRLDVWNDANDPKRTFGCACLPYVVGYEQPALVVRSVV